MKNLLAGLLVAGWLLTPAARGADAAAQPAAARKDIEVTVRHLDGTVETFDEEVSSLEVVTGPASEIKYVHLVLMTGSEKDTHLWYNYANLASLRYRFLLITGKGKVSVKRLGEFAVEAPKGLQRKVERQTPDDFK